MYACMDRLPGDYGFDPLGLGKDPAFLKWYREAELIHGRWAMTAIIGIFVGQAWSGIPWFEAGADPGAVAPFSFGTLLGTQLLLMGWVESKRWVDFFDQDSQSVEWATPWPRTAENFANATGEQGYPGGKLFDPLSLGGTDQNGVSAGCGEAREIEVGGDQVRSHCNGGHAHPLLRGRAGEDTLGALGLKT